MKDLCVATFDLLMETVKEAIPDPRREAFKLVTGKLKESPFTERLISSVRNKWAGLLMDPLEALVVDERQPFLLRGLAQALTVLEDADVGLLVDATDSFATSVYFGIDRPLPRSPQNYPRKTKHRKLDETEFSPFAANYVSDICEGAGGQVQGGGGPWTDDTDKDGSCQGEVWRHPARGSNGCDRQA